MKSIKTVMIVALLVAVPILLAPVEASAQAPQFKLDHFKCWTVQDAPPAHDFVLLLDQFDRSLPGLGPEQVFVGFPALFCNPTVKTLPTGVETPIHNADHHLKMYQITTHPTPVRNVVVRNQFGDLTLTVFQPIFLAVPTQKDTHPAPVGLDHFKCYLARGTLPNQPTVILQDQFDKDRELVQVARPVLLCNPAVKFHPDPTTIVNPDEHLVCYTFTPPTLMLIGVKTRNQFGVEKLTAAYSRLLCVPSLKTEI